MACDLKTQINWPVSKTFDRKIHTQADLENAEARAAQQLAEVKRSAAAAAAAAKKATAAELDTLRLESADALRSSNMLVEVHPPPDTGLCLSSVTPLDTKLFWVAVRVRCEHAKEPYTDNLQQNQQLPMTS